MNRSEKLLEAIGQIDDRLILDAEKSGGGAVGTTAQKAVRRKKRKKKAAVLRYQPVLAACAVLAVCLGIYGVLTANGLIISPFGGGSDSAQESKITAEVTTDTTMDVAEAEDAAYAVEEAAEEEAAEPAEASEETTGQEAAAQDSSTDSAGKESQQSNGQGAEVVTESAKQESASAEETAGKETAPAVPECETETSSEEENAGIELALAQEPMVMSLDPEADDVSGNDTGQNQNLAAVSLTAKLVRTSGADVTLSLSNQYTDAMVTYGSMYELEHKTKEGWNEVAPKDNVLWVDVLYELEPGRSTTETVRLATMYGELEAGHYRLVKNCTVIAADQTEEKIVIYTEFDIVN